MGTRPAPATVTPAVIPTVAAPTKPSGGTSYNKSGKCKHCTALGSYNNHTDDRCFINPKSADFKPATRQKKLALYVAKGGTIPKWILDEGHFDPNAPPPSVNFLTDNEAEDLVAALELLGHVSGDEAQGTV